MNAGVEAVQSEAAIETQNLRQALVSTIEGATSQMPAARQRLNVDPANVRKGLGQLAMTILKLLHEVLERQAIRRMENGTLTDGQVEELGTTLMLQAREIEKLCDEFGLEPADLNLDLGPLGKLM
jgi:hypothetical protein